jgi:hypothetical protein
MTHAADNNPHTGGRITIRIEIPAVAVGLKDADKLAAAKNNPYRFEIQCENARRNRA